jgi:hypothetical protein
MTSELDNLPDHPSTDWTSTPITTEIVRGALELEPTQYGVLPHRLPALDGRELHGEAEYAELPLPDALHPDTAAHRRMGEHFAAHAFAPDGPFKS